MKRLLHLLLLAATLSHGADEATLRGAGVAKKCKRAVKESCEVETAVVRA